ncbi:hypothetical protein L3X38_032642 [Prunus dulcis]|uniref:Uncharacterized protein n=1 Tax=Prunus dulcis TaxID=3755 RepID=A0AAD4VEI3_PRUDU|nr:hypothetical protein L3X38_032642 [Prunus dulcis]
MDEKPYLTHLVWAAEAAARRRETSGSNQSSSWPEFVISDGENWLDLIGTSRRIDRDWWKILELGDALWELVAAGMLAAAE